MERTGKKKYYTLVEAVMIAQSAAIGFAAKPLISGLAHLITGPLSIPGGSVAGGLYMMFLVIPAALFPHHGVAALTGLLQSVLAMATGIGNHGPLTVLSYTLPGIAVDLIMLIPKIRRRASSIGTLHCLFAGMAANIAGSFVVSSIFFALPPVPLLLMLFSAALSGAFGGLLALSIIKPLRKVSILKQNS